MLVESMDQVLEAALRRKPQPLKPPPPQIVEGDTPLADAPSAPTKVRRGFPGPDQPPAVARPAKDH